MTPEDENFEEDCTCGVCNYCMGYDDDENEDEEDEE